MIGKKRRKIRQLNALGEAPTHFNKVSQLRARFSCFGSESEKRDNEVERKRKAREKFENWTFPGHPSLQNILTAACFYGLRSLQI